MNVVANQNIINYQSEVDEMSTLVPLIRHMNVRGHNPATSGNYSIRSTTAAGAVLISESGVDKSLFSEKNLLFVDIHTGQFWNDLKYPGRKSSDETALHLAVYRATNAGCVLHSHMLDSLLFADLHPGQDVIEIQGLELLKGLKGITTHEHIAKIPCFDNTQDIEALSIQVEKALADVSTFAILLRGHGLYVWGERVKDAKRHLEVFEYLFRYYVASKGRH